MEARLCRIRSSTLPVVCLLLFLISGHGSRGETTAATPGATGAGTAAGDNTPNAGSSSQADDAHAAAGASANATTTEAPADDLTPVAGETEQTGTTDAPAEGAATEAESMTTTTTTTTSSADVTPTSAAASESTEPPGSGTTPSGDQSTAAQATEGATTPEVSTTEAEQDTTTPEQSTTGETTAGVTATPSAGQTPAEEEATPPVEETTPAAQTTTEAVAETTTSAEETTTEESVAETTAGDVTTPEEETTVFTSTSESTTESEATTLPENKTIPDVSTPSGDTLAERADYVVRGQDDLPCLLASLVLTISVTYQVQEGPLKETYQTMSYTTPRDAAFTGTCGATESVLSLSWGNSTFNLNVTFELTDAGYNPENDLNMDVAEPSTTDSDSSTWRVTELTLSYDTSDAAMFPAASDPKVSTVSLKDLNLFQTPLHRAYLCQTPDMLQMDAKNVHLSFNYVHLQPFGVRPEQHRRFAEDIVQCSGDLGSVPEENDAYTVPLIVACCLAAAVVIIIVAYASHRYVTRRIRQSEYRQME